MERILRALRRDSTLSTPGILEEDRVNRGQLERFEAQVFVRLTSEPAAAETYIPAGLFETEQEALEAADQRARRALDENEF